MLEPTTFNAQNSNRTFVIALHENPALMLGAELQNQISSAAPGIRLRFALPETQLLPAQMENGDVDIYVGVNAVAHDAWVRRKLFDDEYATAQRKGHPRGTGPMDLDSYCSLSHLVVSSEGDPFAGFVDQHLAGLGHQRNVVMSTQSYAMAPAIVAGTDLLCTLPRRMLLRFTQTLDIFRRRWISRRSSSVCTGTRKTARIRLTAGCENSFFRPPDVRYDRGYSSIFSAPQSE